jgi:hypothetical protein
MKEPFEKNLRSTNYLTSSHWRRQASLALGCTKCHHEVKVHETPMTEDQLRLLARKRLNSSLAIVAGVAAIFFALFYLMQRFPPTWPNELNHFGYDMLTIFVMLFGIMVTFVGISALIFGYQTQQEAFEGS